MSSSSNRGGVSSRSNSRMSTLPPGCCRVARYSCLMLAARMPTPNVQLQWQDSRKRVMSRSTTFMLIRESKVKMSPGTPRPRRLAGRYGNSGLGGYDSNGGGGAKPARLDWLGDIHDTRPKVVAGV